MKLKEIQRRVQSEIHVNVNMSKCRREKNMVTSRLGGNMKEEFANLWVYADELQAKNPGSTIKMAVNRVSDNSPPHFKRFYGSKYIGKKGMYPIAWAIVEGEITDSWSWFLNIVVENLGLDDGFGYTIISDQHKGIEIALNDVLPRVKLRNCARHVFANWTGSKKEKMWTKAFQMMHSKSDIVGNNLCEAFNSSIVDARYKSIIIMLEEIRVKIMTRIVEKQRFLTTWKYNFGPLIKKKFNIMKKDSIQWRMIWNGDNGCLNIDGNSSIKSPSTINSNPTHVSRKGKEKEKASVTFDRSMRKKRYAVIGLYTNLRTGEQTFYSGTRAPKKRKGDEDHMVTQESVAPKKE
ncbi:hypothetical protein F3Y22_tig00113722pilonHSYRG00349 [Hibiscus syriacus]|uniref:MULE transposase domain-containing protein n=1 Tax=Hibiscus syriacus TaxID=106335 RepID=A0A6A2WQ16_HIBSY|nr:hypothetical protein F3Y22_tig00113722pilonHSYRG00349 [Hibiscus syriacus]